MLVGPGGSMQDGLFDTCMFEPTPLAHQLIDLRHLYDGQISRSRGISTAQTKKLIARSDELVHIELDGETRGHLPANFEIKSAAINMRGGWIGV